MNKYIILTAIVVLAYGSLTYSLEESRLKNTWELGFTFGEIPILAGSFKPGITVAYHFNENLALSATCQLKDHIQRDNESFNAVNTGLGGLLESKETTGERILFAVQYRPVKWSPYIMAGFVYNNRDVETMKFDQQTRTIGSQEYDSAITIEQTRDAGFVPAIGFGYRYDFDNGISLNTNIAAGIFTGIPDPGAEINSSVPLTDTDHHSLMNKMMSVYKDNFHNHYHIFNLGVSYRFK